jgi:superfamily II DNA or RNA helicase
MSSPFQLSPEEELALQQLQQIDFWQQRVASSTADDVRRSSEIEGNPHQPLPAQWELTRDVVLHDWQAMCVDNWFAAGKRGVVKVVTGAGKTTLALAIIERLQQTATSDLRVAIVVPTVVLLDQWYSEILKSSNLPSSCIGFIGGGRSDSFHVFGH